MRKKIILPILAIVVVLCLTAQAGYALYTMGESQTAADEANEPLNAAALVSSSPSPTPTPVEVVPAPVTAVKSIELDIASITIPDPILTIIKESAPQQYEKNVANYKNMLVSLNVHSKLQGKIEQLLVEGNRLPDILIAYEYIYQQFGTLQEVTALVAQRKSGKQWEAVFSEYNAAQTIFEPRAFEPDYLERVMKTPGLTADDIMIADRISYKTGEPVQELLKKKESRDWKDINSELGILFSAAALPRVSITVEQLEKFKQQAGITEQQVAEAFVLAGKLVMKPEDVIGQLKSGMSEAAIYAASYTAKYGSTN